MVFMIVGVVNFCWVFGSLLTILLCIVGEFVGGESVAVADGISDR